VFPYFENSISPFKFTFGGFAGGGFVGGGKKPPFRIRVLESVVVGLGFAFLE